MTSTREEGFAHLHCRSWYSFLRGASSPSEIVARAAELGQEHVALTDWMTVAGAVKLHLAARAAGVRPVVGAEVVVDGAPLVLLCADRGGYSTLCRLLTLAWEDREAPCLPLEALADDSAGLICLTGGREGTLRRLLEANQNNSALEWARRLSSLMPGRAFIEVSHHRRPWDSRMVARLSTLARVAGLPAVASNDVRYARPEDAALHDLLVCTRLGITVNESHPERPFNREAHLKGGDEMRALVFDPAARANSVALARECSGWELLSGSVSPPEAVLPAGATADGHLARLCREGLPARYRGARRRQASAQLEREFAVIARLRLADFFLVVHEIVAWAKERGIRCAGRGSAANSVAAHCLGITGVDPVEHCLVFERFLHQYRRGVPDIDVDFASHRRPEVLTHVWERFEGRCAMVANVNSYGLRGAVRDAAKALGWPLDQVGRMTKALPHEGRPRHAERHRAELEAVAGPSPLLDRLLELAPLMDGCPRDLSVHSGGMLLTAGPVTDFSPTLVSSGGNLQAVYDKEDVESLGLVKLDILGLRALSAIGEALELHEGATGERIELDDVPLDDPETFDLVLSGETVGLFQLESPGQQATIAKHQPRDFAGLVAQVSLLRPGPIQSGSIHPFVRRARGLEATTYPHPSLEPVLRETHGTFLYQEQVLQAANVFAGLALDEADEFRRLTSRARSREELEALRGRFVEGALAAHEGLEPQTAHAIFDQVSAFSGYGFPKSHAVAFARHAYETAYLKAHFPAAYFAAFLTHHPGMFPRQTLIAEAQRRGVRVLPPDLERSALRFSLEPSGGALAIRMPLESVQGVGDLDARALLLERAARPFGSLEDLWRRAAVAKDVLFALAEAGALGAFGHRREVVWKLGVLEQKSGRPGSGAAPLLEAAVPELEDLPSLEELTALEKAVWDRRAARATTGPHPVALLRGELDRAGVVPISRLWGGEAAVAGLVAARQRPPSAKGVVFLYLEDESGRVQCVVAPGVYEAHRPALLSGAVVVAGRVRRMGAWRGLVASAARPLEAAGGRAGPPRA